MNATLQTASNDTRNSVARTGNVGELTLQVIATSCKWLPGLAKSLWPAKPAAALHFLTNAPERTCYEWVRGKVDPPSRVVIKLLRSDQGWRVLEYIMRDNSQRWWLETVRARECSQAYEARREQLSLPL